MGGKQVAIIKETEPTRPIKVLLVDDEDRFRSSLAERLTLREFDVTEAANGEEAIRLFDVHAETVDLAFLDVVMPGVGGRAVSNHIREARDFYAASPPRHLRNQQTGGQASRQEDVRQVGLQPDRQDALNRQRNQGHLENIGDGFGHHTY